MSRSAIYTANTFAPTVAAGDIVPFGATLTPSAAGTVTLTAQKDGVAIPGATASATAGATDVAIDLSITCIVRNACGCGSSLLSLALSGGEAVVNNLAVTVEKL